MTDQEHRRNPIEALAEEFLASYRRGERPSLSEYTAQNPELAEEIRDLFPALLVIEEAGQNRGRLDEVHRDVIAPGARVPERLGDYYILREVGRGGMGIVYEAEQESLRRRVALKVLPRPIDSDPLRLARFHREARAAARLHHTNIVPVFDVGECRGIHYYAMQFIEGLALDTVLNEVRRLRAVGVRSLLDQETLDAATDDRPAALATLSLSLASGLVQGRLGFEDAELDTAAARTQEPREPMNHLPGSEPLPGVTPAGTPGAGFRSGPSRLSDSDLSSQSERRYYLAVARVGFQVAQALAYAHAHRVLHRDIKPANLLLDGSGTVWVTDFGLAKEEGDELSRSGDLVGTLRYMAPERFNGHADTRSDLYSLGLTLYELVTLRPAFSESDRNHLIRQVLHDEPIAPRKLDRQAPRDLETIILKAIAKESRRRYASAQELADDLQRFIRGEPIRARQVNTWERALKWARRRPAMAALAVTVQLLAVALLATGIWSYVEIRRSLALAKVERSKAEELARTEATALDHAQEQEKIAEQRAEDLARQDYINRVNRADRELEDGNLAEAKELLDGCPSERRGWEWHYVRRLCNPERLTLLAEADSVEAVAYSPDGSWIVSAAGVPSFSGAYSGKGEAEVVVQEVATGQRRRALRGLPGIPHSLAVNPEGTRIAGGSGTFGGTLVAKAEGQVVVWDATTGQVCWRRGEPGLHAMAVAFRDDGKTLAVGYGLYSLDTPIQGRVVLYEVSTGRETRVFPGPKGGVHALAWGADGTRLAITGWETAEVWDVPAGVKVKECRGHNRWVYSVAFSPDGRGLATGGWDKTIKLWDLGTGAERLTIFGHRGFVLSVRFSPDGRFLLSTSEDRSVRLWEIPSGRESAIFHGHEDFVQCAAFRPDGREIATGSVDGTLRLWDLKTSRPVVFDGHRAWVGRIAVRRDGRRVFTQDNGPGPSSVTTCVWDPESGEEDPTLRGVALEGLGPDYEIGWSMDEKAVSADGRLFAAPAGEFTRGTVGYGGRAAEIWELVTMRRLFLLVGHTSDIVCLGFSPDGRRLVTGSDDRTIKLWDTATGREVITLRGHTGGLRALAFTPDGNRIISSSTDGVVRVWNGTTFSPAELRDRDARHHRALRTIDPASDLKDPAFRIELHAAAGRWKEAAEAVRTLIEVTPDNLMLWQKEQVLLTLAGDLDGARCVNEALLRRFGNAPSLDKLLHIVGSCCRTPGSPVDPETALHLADQLVQQSPESLKGVYRVLEAWVQFRAGRLAAAKGELELWINTPGHPISPQIYCVLAMIEHRLGHRAQARAWLEKVPRYGSGSQRVFSWPGLFLHALRREAEMVLGLHQAQEPPAGQAVPDGTPSSTSSSSLP